MTLENILADRSKMSFSLSLFPMLVFPTHFPDTLRTHG